jgi:hypothetical protein
MAEIDNKSKNSKAENIVSKNNPTSKTPATNSPKEIGGPKGAEPTRYGDWEKNGRCTDF